MYVEANAGPFVAPLTNLYPKFATLLKNDKVPLTYPITGITHRLRFNQEKLKKFIETPRNEWYNESLCELMKLLPNPLPKKKK